MVRIDAVALVAFATYTFSMPLDSQARGGLEPSQGSEPPNDSGFQLAAPPMKAGNSDVNSGGLESSLGQDAGISGNPVNSGGLASSSGQDAGISGNPDANGGTEAPSTEETDLVTQLQTSIKGALKVLQQLKTERGSQGESEVPGEGSQGESELPGDGSQGESEVPEGGPLGSSGPGLGGVGTNTPVKGIENGQ
ncbi:uncharacterized protein MAM_06399 [Metarhizium album ARSEF 1941]|uniref:Uncharacterized protein n=1 Tax=Metarhizium album (strain ARSEF 1941) TaxID=1081103 RepID=A0A0B2WQM5_METAS|nr:uncharacterized protein MAM_06399 [Metarhizium album ARSEF 1941]KHN95787.1 hypothetical protein MAM_06399 [Metarhizium album ARSEF 1941]